MVQTIDFTRPVYNAVNINIRKPEINKGKNVDGDDNGIYNSVNVGIDNPAINTEPRKVYDYPESEEIVTFDKVRAQQNALPQGYPILAQYEASAIVIPDEAENGKDVAVPKENFTSVEDEKAEKKTLNDENSASNVSFHGSDDVKKTPEIIPSENIVPEVNISNVVSNLSSQDYDVQALQMNDIVKLVEEPEKAKEYLVSDVISSLMNIAEKDTSELAGPTKEQENIRGKVIANFLAIQQNVNNDVKNLPYQISDDEAKLAITLSPLEMAERNKEYALITMAMLDKVYIDDIEKENGNVVALTDVPGISTMFDALRYSQNATVKIAAIDSLRYIYRPEYKNELNEVLMLAKSDLNPAVSQAADYTLQKINN